MMSTKGPTHNCAQFPTTVVGKERIYRVAPRSPPWSSSLFFLIFLFFFPAWNMAGFFKGHF